MTRANARMGSKTRMTMPMNGKPSPYVLNHTGAQLKVTFPAAGT